MLILRDSNYSYRESCEKSVSSDSIDQPFRSPSNINLTKIILCRKGDDEEDIIVMESM